MSLGDVRGTECPRDRSSGGEEASRTLRPRVMHGTGLTDLPGKVLRASPLLNIHIKTINQKKTNNGLHAQNMSI